MGHSLQMWLQLMWFLARSRDDGTVVLDEPDVYMHPDLQRRLLRFVLSRNQQVIIATHSVEMMAEVDPEDLLPIDASRRSARRTSSITEVQRIVEQLGSVHNLQYARLARADVCLIAPASDVPQLKRWSDLLANPNDRAIDTLPMLPCNSWASWPYVVAAKRTIDKSRGSAIEARCFMPSDRMPPDFLAQRQQDAANNGMDLHIWRRCDLTTYLLRPDIIARLLSKQTVTPVDPQLVADEVWAASERLRADVARELRSNWRALRQPVDDADAFMSEAWVTMAQRLRVLSGRELLLGVSAWSQAAYGVRIGLRDVAREFAADDLDVEVQRALRVSIANTPDAEVGNPEWPWQQVAIVPPGGAAPDADDIMRLLFGVSGST